MEKWYDSCEGMGAYSVCVGFQMLLKHEGVLKLQQGVWLYIYDAFHL